MKYEENTIPDLMCAIGIFATLIAIFEVLSSRCCTVAKSKEDEWYHTNSADEDASWKTWIGELI